MSKQNSGIIAIDILLELYEQMNQEIYLIRHTTPAVEKGICYGQSDIDVKESFYDEARIIKTYLPLQIEAVYSSPLIRCKKLAEHLFPQNNIHTQPTLMEINCGQWEMRHWDHIPKEEIDPWMQDFVQVCIPGGESYTDLYNRVVHSLNTIIDTANNTAIVTHGGVIRSMLSHITQTPLIDSFKQFSLHYGCVIKITVAGQNLKHEILSNIATEKEKHKPAGM